MSPWRVRRRLFALCGRSWPTIRALLPRRRDPPAYVDLGEHTRKALIREAEYQAKADEENRILRRNYKTAPKGQQIPGHVVRITADPREYFVPCSTPGCPLQFSHGGVCPDGRD